MRETLKSQLAILFILLLIFFCQKLVRILGAAVDGDIPANLVLSLLGLGVPEMAQAYPGAVGEIEHGWYLPYAVIDEQQGLALVESLSALTREHKPFPEVLSVGKGRGAGGSDVLHPLREGVGRLYYSDINDPRGPAATGAAIPVIIAQPESGARDADVLFMDGHKERVPMGRFPLSPAVLEALSALDPPEH